MTQFIPREKLLRDLADKVVVLSGASTGIGAATVTLLHQQGAKVVFGDVNVKDASKLVDKIRRSRTSSAVKEGEEGGEVSFVKTDVTRYEDIYNLFKTAHERYGRIDHAVSCAGIFERQTPAPGWFDADLTIDSVADVRAPTTVLDVNVVGSANFARIAVVFLRDGFTKDMREQTTARAGVDKSVVLLSSVNAFRESPGLYMYQASKHAIQGLMRAMRKPIFDRDGLRVNCVCPGMTESNMTKGPVLELFQKDDELFWQTSEAVAHKILGVLVQRDMNGKAIYVEGGDAWEFEDTFYAAQPQWLGEEATRRMRANAGAVNKGALSATSK